MTKTGLRAAVCWIGNPRYTQPLNATDEKKWRLLRSLDRPLIAIAFHNGLGPRRFDQEGTSFYLLPDVPGAPIRYLLMLTVGFALGLWVVLRRDARLLIAQSPYEGAVAGLVKLAARLLGRRVAVVVENHGDFEEALFLRRRISLVGLYRWVMQTSARFAFRQTDGLRAVSDSTREQMTRYAPNLPTFQFAAWTDASAFREAVRPGPPSSSQQIIFPAMLTRLKSPHRLIQVFSELRPALPEARLHLAGQALDQSYLAELRQQVSALGLENEVTFHGMLPQRELAAQMAAARVAVLPSATEGLPRALIEAMFTGTPVIGTRVGGVPELIEPGVSGWLIDYGDDAALKACLWEAFASDRVDAMGEAARQRAEQFFSEQRYLDGYQALIEQMMRMVEARKE
jgi:glycosyltransferase involved in cell wall biosynthesis